MVAEISWHPSPGRIAAANLTRFSQLYQPTAADYQELHAWSIQEPGTFWTALWDFAGVKGERGDCAYRTGQDLRTCRFFPEARLNYAENLLVGDDQRLAVIFVNEDGLRRTLTMGELRSQVAAIRGALDAAGVKSGDRVAALVANTPETLAAMLATQALGAIWSSCSPDFGLAGTADRFGLITPKVLFASDGYRYKGQLFDNRPAMAEMLRILPSLEQIVILPHMFVATKTTGIAKTVSLTEFVAEHHGDPLNFQRQSMASPSFILYSSGTTGKPKCITHSGNGLLLKHLSELLFHCNVKPSEKIFYYSTCSWMMWNWHVSALATGATLVLYDGHPMHPATDRLATLAQDEHIAHFGVSAKFLDACAKAAVAPLRSHQLPALKAIYSTGSPLSPASFDYVYQHWKEDVHLASISGGTDICGCFLGGLPIAPVRRGELQVAELGCDMAVFDATGSEVFNSTGELVCRNAIPSMPVKFWGDDDGSQYQRTYFARFPGVWCHGDWSLHTATGSFVITGRSDATLNPGGVRIGTAEIYRPVEDFTQIAEAVAVGQEWEGDQRILLFVRLRPGASLTTDLRAEIKTAIRQATTARHVPAMIVAVADIPRTRSGKIAELAIKAVIHGRPVPNINALANPEALDLFRAI